MLEPLFGFLLNFDPVVSVLIYSVIVLFVINIFYKILINQEEARQIKNRSKELNQEMKIAQKEKNTERSKKLLDELLAENNKLMKLTMKPMMISLLIVLVMLPTLSTFYGDKIIDPDTGETQVQSLFWQNVVPGEAGSVEILSEKHTVARNNNTITFDSESCEMPCSIESDTTYKISKLDEKFVKIAPVIVTLPIALPFFGGVFGWLGWYIILSIPIAVLLRKLMKIYI